MGSEKFAGRGSANDPVAQMIAELVSWQRRARRERFVAEAERFARELAVDFLESSDGDRDRIARDGLRKTARMIGADRVYVALGGPGRRRWTWYADRPPRPGERIEHLIALPRAAIADAGRAVRAGAGLLSPTADGKPAAINAPVRSLCWLPLMRDGRVTGLVGAHAESRSIFWSEERQSLLRAVGDMIAKIHSPRRDW